MAARTNFHVLVSSMSHFYIDDIHAADRAGLDKAVAVKWFAPVQIRAQHCRQGLQSCISKEREKKVTRVHHPHPIAVIFKKNSPYHAGSPAVGIILKRFWQSRLLNTTFKYMLPNRPYLVLGPSPGPH